MPRIAALALALSLAAPVAGAAREDPPAQTELEFLQVGKSYLIRFPEDLHPVLVKESGMEPQPSGPPATWKATWKIDVFVVRKLGRGSWALLEHPEDPKAALDCIAARHLLADEAKVAEIEADPKRKDFLAGRRKAAASELKTKQTWVNLAHAISIADPPADHSWDLKIRVGAP
jgi:hypothetical protein